jgi:hypothetical protein
MSKKFPDLNKDGKITKADVLIGRGVIKATKGDVIDFNKKKAQKNPGFETKILRTKKELSKEVEKTQKAKKKYGDKTKPRYKNVSVTGSKKDLADIAKQLGRSQVGQFTKTGRLSTAAQNLSGKASNIAGKALGVVSVLIPKEMGSAELKNIEKKKYGGPVGVKMAKGGFKKKTPIY